MRVANSVCNPSGILGGLAVYTRVEYARCDIADDDSKGLCYSILDLSPLTHIVRVEDSTVSRRW